MNIKCYDLGSEHIDRYTVVYMDYPDKDDTYACVGMSANPFHPQGVGQHSITFPGKHLGKRIKFEDLPEDCQKAVKQDFENENKI